MDTHFLNQKKVGAGLRLALAVGFCSLFVVASEVSFAALGTVPQARFSILNPKIDFSGAMQLFRAPGTPEPSEKKSERKGEAQKLKHAGAQSKKAISAQAHEAQMKISRWLSDKDQRWLRGEIEEERIREKLYSTVLLALVGAREFSAEKRRQLWQDVLGFVGDLFYEESSRAGKEVAQQIRSWVFEEMEAFEIENAKIISQTEWINWAKTLKTPWPMDRVLLQEGSRILSNRNRLEKYLRLFQKNMHQSLATLAPDESAEFRSLWTEVDVQNMHKEIVRRGAFQMRWARQLAQMQFHADPQSLQDWKRVGLESLPLNYSTGKSMTLEEANAARQVLR